MDDRGQPQQETGRVVVEDRVRFADLDPIGHCNNAAISGFVESARVRLLGEHGLPSPGRDEVFVIVRQEIVYLRELGLDHRVLISAAVSRFGNSSLEIATEVARDGEVVATATTTAVLIDMTSRRPLRIAEDLRRRLSAPAENRMPRPD